MPKIKETTKIINLNYSRAEVAVDARPRVRSCGPSPQVPCNVADAVRSARLKGKKMAIKIKIITRKIFRYWFLIKACVSLK